MSLGVDVQNILVPADFKRNSIVSVEFSQIIHNISWKYYGATPVITDRESSRREERKRGNNFWMQQKLAASYVVAFWWRI
jgi:hypothetical protein